MTGSTTSERRRPADTRLALPTQHVPAPAGYVQVPRELLADLAAGRLRPLDVAVWVLLADLVARAARVADVVTPSRARLLTGLGRWGRDPDAVSAATDRLAAAGWLNVTPTHRAGKTRNAYRVLRAPLVRDGRPYVTLPRDALVVLAAGTIGPELVATLLAYLDAAGREGRTADTLATVAGRLAASVRTVRRHRRALLAAGLLVELVHPGRLPLTARPGRLPEHRPATAGGAPVQAADPGHRTSNTPATEPATPRPQNRHVVTSRKTYLPKDLPVPVVPSRRDLTNRSAREPEPSPSAPKDKSSSARTRPAAARPAPSRSIRPSSSTPATAPALHPLACAVLAALPSLRSAPAWVRSRALLPRLSAALADGYGPAAIVRTARAVLDDEPTNRHDADLRRCLGALRADVLAGACRSCARHPDDDLTFEVCSACHPDELNDVDPVELAAVRAALGLTPTGASQVAPDGAAYAAAASA